MISPTMMPSTTARQRGLALPIMLIMLVVMLVSSVYLLKSSNSTAMVTSNLAYESALSRAVDLGLLTGFQWLGVTAAGNKALLDADSPANGYVASLNTALAVSDPAFWTGSVTFTDTTASRNRIEYVVHRMCLFAGAYNQIGPPANSCMQTSAVTSNLSNSIALGDSLSSDAVQFAGAPQIHYVITARIFGPRGGNVVNQAVVMIGV